MLLAACPGRPQRPHVPPAPAQTIAIAGAVRAVGADELATYAAAASKAWAFRGGKPAWEVELPGKASVLARAGELVAIGVAASGGSLRGDPGAIVVAHDRKTGKQRWSLAFDSTEWAIVSSVTALGNDLIVGGLFAGTLRVGTRVVSSGGNSDGFVARVGANGQLAWLVRMGGVGADGVQGVAVRGERIAIAGTFAAGADLLGQALVPYDDRSPVSDAFVAELDGKGARQWAATFGGKGDDAIAGVTIDDTGNVVVAANVREVVHVGGAQLVTQGASDGLVAWFGKGGEKGPAVLVGGLDYDGLRAIVAVGDRVVVGGFFSGSIKLGERTLKAGGGDDAFIAALDGSGTVATSWHIGGAGREEVAALDATSGGFVAGIQHTAAATIEDTKLAAPKDPMAGSALIVRGVP